MRLDHLSKLVSSSVTPRQSRSWSSTLLLVVTTFDPPLINAFEAMIPPLTLRYPTIPRLLCSCNFLAPNWLPFEHIRQGILNPSWLPWIVPPESYDSTRRVGHPRSSHTLKPILLSLSSTRRNSRMSPRAVVWTSDEKL